MKLKKELSNLLRNKMVLHIVSLLALLTVIGYGMLNNLNAVALFIIISIIVFFFSKNMIIVLGVPLILVNLFVYMRGIKEGMENKKSHYKKPSSTNSQTVLNSTNAPIPPKKEGDHKYKKEEYKPEEHKVDESFEVGKAKQSGGYKIDYASTVEDAYNDLNKILGGGGMQKLTADTQNLMKQQMQLAEAMKTMQPLMEGMGPLMQQAQTLLGGLKDDDKGLGGIMEMVKQFAPQQKQ
jgi:hypothetical protein